MRRLKQLKDENTKLKKLVAELSSDREMLQDVIRRNAWSAPPLQGVLKQTKNSLRKCIRPLASGLRLRPGHDEIRACRFH
jgi:putative transposase